MALKPPECTAEVGVQCSCGLGLTPRRRSPRGRYGLRGDEAETQQRVWT